jgi:hypothetical protein
MNPATRLLTLYDTLTAIGNDVPMTNIWATVFELDAQSATIEDDATACLMALRSEIDLVSAKLALKGVPLELTNPGFTRLRSTASPTFLNQGWNGLRGNIQAPECRHAFAWSAWVLLDDEDDDILVSDKADILAALEEFESSLAQSDLSPYLRDFALRQVTTIRYALRASKVQGVKPLREAMRKFAGDLKVEDAKFRDAAAATPESGKRTLAAMVEVVDKAAKVCDGVEKVGKFAYSIGGIVNDFIHMLPQ